MKLYSIKDASDLYFKSIVDGTPQLFIDYANSVSVSIESGVVYSKAKGVNRTAFKDGTTGTIEISTDLADSKLFALLLGSSIVTTSADVAGKVVATVSGGKVSLSDTPTTGSVSVMLTEGERTWFTVGGTVSPTNCTVSGKDITFDSTMNGKSVTILYMKAGVGSQKFTVNVNQDSSAMSLTMFTKVTLDQDNTTRFCQLNFPKVKPQNSASFSFDASTPSSFSIKLDILSDASGNMMDWIELA